MKAFVLFCTFTFGVYRFGNITADASSLTSLINNSPSTKDRFTIQGRLRADLGFLGNQDFRDQLRLRDFDLNFTGELTDMIKLVVRTRLSMLIRNQGEDAEKKWKNGAFDIEEFFHTAYVQISNIGGQPIAFLIGKQRMAFGQDFTRMPNDHLTPTHTLAELDQVIGFTMVLDTAFFNFVDKIEMSVFESSKGDWKIDALDGYALRLSKKVTQKLKASLSYIHKGNTYNEKLNAEDMVSLGLIFTTKEWTIWVEGFGLIHSNQYPDSSFAITAGVSRRLWHGEIASEFTFINEALFQWGLGYTFEVTKNFSIGPEIRHIWSLNGRDNELILGMRAIYYFGAESDKYKAPLFGTRGSRGIATALHGHARRESENSQNEYVALKINGQSFLNTEIQGYGMQRDSQLPPSPTKDRIPADLMRTIAWQVLLENEGETLGANVDESLLNDKNITVNNIRQAYDAAVLEQLRSKSFSSVFISPKKIRDAYQRYKSVNDTSPPYTEESLKQRVFSETSLQEFQSDYHEAQRLAHGSSHEALREAYDSFSLWAVLTHAPMTIHQVWLLDIAMKIQNFSDTVSDDELLATLQKVYANVLSEISTNAPSEKISEQESPSLRLITAYKKGIESATTLDRPLLNRLLNWSLWELHHRTEMATIESFDPTFPSLAQVSERIESYLTQREYERQMAAVKQNILKHSSIAMKLNADSDFLTPDETMEFLVHG